MHKKGEARISNWRLREDGRLEGLIHDHPDQRAGLAPNPVRSTTTPVVAIDTAAGWAETRNTMYTLEDAA